MMNITTIIIPLLLFCLPLIGCEMENVDTTTGPQTDVTVQNQSKYFRQSGWPPVNSGKTVELAANPVADNYYVVLDGSGSMTYTSCADGKERIEVAKNAIKEFVTMLSTDVNTGMLAFDNSGITERVPLGLLNKKVFNDAVDAVVANNGTPLYTSIKMAYEKLEVQARKQLGSGTYHLVIVTDGDASVGENPASIVNTILMESPVMIHTIGFCIGKNHVLNQPGKTVYVAASNPEELREGLKGVLAELPTFVGVQ